MARPDDVAQIASILSEAFAEYESFYTDEGFAATTPPGEQIQERLDEGPVWIALLRDVIVGTVAVVPRGEALYIRGMAVSPAARGQGIGKILLEHVERFAARSDYKYLTLSTTPFLDSAIRLYERFGFRRSRDGPHDLFGTPLFTMMKSLKPSE